jgi:hypothetical protein
LLGNSNAKLDRITSERTEALKDYAIWKTHKRDYGRGVRDPRADGLNPRYIIPPSLHYLEQLRLSIRRSRMEYRQVLGWVKWRYKQVVSDQTRPALRSILRDFFDNHYHPIRKRPPAHMMSKVCSPWIHRWTGKRSVRSP